MSFYFYQSLILQEYLNFYWRKKCEDCSGCCVNLFLSVSLSLRWTVHVLLSVRLCHSASQRCSSLWCLQHRPDSWHHPACLLRHGDRGWDALCARTHIINCLLCICNMCDECRFTLVMNICDWVSMCAAGGGWTVFQRRRDGSVSFNRGWSEYRGGFGEPRGEHWLGNQPLHLLSNHGHYSLRIDLQDWSHAHRHALYHTFR